MQVCTITVPFIAAWKLQKLKKTKLSTLSDAVIVCIGTTKDCSDKLPFLQIDYFWI